MSTVESIMDYYDADFKRRKMEPMYWFNKSSEMRNSAGALWFALSNTDDVNEWLKLNCNIRSGADYSAFDMLCGLSLELIYKAVIVSKKRPPPDNTHDLNRLRVLADIKATEKEAAILDIYTHAIYWQAKYPVAKKSEYHRNYVKLVDDNLYESIPGLNPKIRKPNNAMGWELFFKLWVDGAENFEKANPNLFG